VSGLRVTDLCLVLDDVGPLVDQAISSGDTTDAFLLAAGASQILRDFLEDDPGHLLRAAAIFDERRLGPAGSALSRTASLASSALRRRSDSRRRALTLAADQLDAVITDLAAGVHSGELPPDTHGAVVRILSDIASQDVPTGADGVRQPSCFRSFDQHPRDLQSLARLVVDRHSPTRARFVVVGVRTSGSYLAPLLAEALGLAGCDPVPWVTVRPHRPPSPSVRSRLLDLAADGVRALVIDDPPTSGGSVDCVVTLLETLGFSPSQVTLALATLAQTELPERLQRHDAVVLDWSDWDIHRRLSPLSVRSMLQDLWADVDIDGLSPFTLPEDAMARGHERAGFRVTAAQSGRQSTLSIVAEGAGLGFLGRHVLAVSDALPGLVPHVVGFNDGIVVRQWIPDEARVHLDTEARVRQAVHYVSSRRSELPARRDAAATMIGQKPAWEVASRILASPYGIVGLAMRSGGLDAAVRSLLTPQTPVVVDGQTGSRSWFEVDGSLVKVSFSERSYSNLDLACYDAAYDAAGVALGATTRELVEVAREAFESESGVMVDPERWLLYRLVHLWDLRRLDQLAADVAEVAASRVWQDWAATRLLGGSLDHGDGPICAVDVDGVLETSRLGAPVLTPSAAAGLHALDAHGYRTVLATGRSATELEDRCARYGLLGGVAEYGGVVYDHRTGVAHELIDEEARAALAAGREFLSGIPGVWLAAHHRASIRAYRLDADGSRVRVDEATCDAVVQAAGGGLKAHAGLAQVDFVPAGVDKASGLEELLTLLDAPSRALSVAVGDSLADLSMLRAAERGFVPAHARRLAQGSVRAMRHGYQRGFHDAVTEVVGHAPSGCAVCRTHDDVPAGAALVAALLSGLEGGRRQGVALVPAILRQSRRAGRGDPAGGS
jgi:adenine/guanine phosphoribosyltransferase-like PRPP-binding protein/phosphoglycolate phosphatase-like HAD superfamily hydrolase